MRAFTIRNRWDLLRFVAVVTAFAMAYTFAVLSLAVTKEVFDAVVFVGLGIAFSLATSISFAIAIGVRRFNELHIQLQEMTERQTRHDAEIRAALRREKEEAEAANLMKSRFLAKMSHELKTPMNGILGLAALMEASPIDAEARERVALLKTAGHEMTALIDDLLDTSMIESGLVQLKTAPTDVPVLIRDVVGRLEPAAQRSGATLRLSVDPALAQIWNVDGKRLKQVISNLVSNAIKYAPGGPIEVRAVPSVGGGIRFEVEDRGAGVPEDLRERIFDRFVQGEEGDDRRAGGVGLGLSICRDLAHLMGGSIGHAPARPHGSVFWFETPLIEAETSQLVA